MLPSRGICSYSGQRSVHARPSSLGSVSRSYLGCELASYHVVFTTICLSLTARHQHASRILIFWIWRVVSRTCWTILYVNINSELALQDPFRCRNQHLIHVHRDHIAKHDFSISHLDSDYLGPF
jgi:hypothetical protein